MHMSHVTDVPDTDIRSLPQKQFLQTSRRDMWENNDNKKINVAINIAHAIQIFPLKVGEKSRSKFLCNRKNIFRGVQLLWHFFSLIKKTFFLCWLRKNLRHHVSSANFLETHIFKKKKKSCKRKKRRIKFLSTEKYLF